MTVTVYSMDDARILEVKRCSPRAAHKYMKWLKDNRSGVYWTCWPTDLSK